MAFELPKLGYDFNALEPHIDARTMEIHYTKHHAAYLTKFNAAIENTELANQSPEEIFANVSSHSGAVRNNGGGYYNHKLFWEWLSPDSSEDLDGNLKAAIDKYFGSLDKLKEEFENAAATRFGSGWAWLIKRENGELVVTSTPNQDNPLMDVAEVKGKPILGLDVWEHAYYLNYQNRRPDYISAFWNVVNWKKVAELYNA